ncbi:unnamed protein product [Tenebrio molitor]|nr:unnamed protein product [Tenebrio molitor]
MHLLISGTSYWSKMRKVLIIFSIFVFQCKYTGWKNDFPRQCENVSATIFYLDACNFNFFSISNAVVSMQSNIFSFHPVRCGTFQFEYFNRRAGEFIL